MFVIPTEDIPFVPNIDKIEKVLNGDLGIAENIEKSKKSKLTNLIPPAQNNEQSKKNKEQAKKIVNSPIPEGVGLRSLEKTVISSMMESQKPQIELALLILEMLKTAEVVVDMLTGVVNPLYIPVSFNGKSLKDQLKKQKKLLSNIDPNSKAAKNLSALQPQTPQEKSASLPKELYIGYVDAATNELVDPPIDLALDPRWYGSPNQFRMFTLKDYNQFYTVAGKRIDGIVNARVNMLLDQLKNAPDNINLIKDAAFSSIFNEKVIMDDGHSKEWDIKTKYKTDAIKEGKHKPEGAKEEEKNLWRYPIRLRNNKQYLLTEKSTETNKLPTEKWIDKIISNLSNSFFDAKEIIIKEEIFINESKTINNPKYQKLQLNNSLNSGYGYDTRYFNTNTPNTYGAQVSVVSNQLKENSNNVYLNISDINENSYQFDPNYAQIVDVDQIGEDDVLNNFGISVNSAILKTDVIINNIGVNNYTQKVIQNNTNIATSNVDNIKNNVIRQINQQTSQQNIEPQFIETIVSVPLKVTGEFFIDPEIMYNIYITPWINDTGEKYLIWGELKNETGIKEVGDIKVNIKKAAYGPVIFQPAFVWSIIAPIYLILKLVPKIIEIILLIIDILKIVTDPIKKAVEFLFKIITAKIKKNFEYFDKKILKKEDAYTVGNKEETYSRYVAKGEKPQQKALDDKNSPNLKKPYDSSGSNFIMGGTAIINLGFIAFGIEHDENANIQLIFSTSKEEIANLEKKPQSALLKFIMSIATAPIKFAIDFIKKLMDIIKMCFNPVTLPKAVADLLSFKFILDLLNPFKLLSGLGFGDFLKLIDKDEKNSATPGAEIPPLPDKKILDSIKLQSDNTYTNTDPNRSNIISNSIIEQNKNIINTASNENSSKLIILGAKKVENIIINPTKILGKEQKNQIIYTPTNTSNDIIEFNNFVEIVDVTDIGETNTEIVNGIPITSSNIDNIVTEPILSPPFSFLDKNTDFNDPLIRVILGMPDKETALNTSDHVTKGTPFENIFKDANLLKTIQNSLINNVPVSGTGTDAISRLFPNTKNSNDIHNMILQKIIDMVKGLLNFIFEIIKNFIEMPTSIFGFPKELVSPVTSLIPTL